MIAGLADPLLAPALAAVERRAGQPKITADLTTIVEVAVEHLVDQHLGADRADAFKLGKVNHLGLRRAGLGGAPFSRAPLLKLGLLLDHQAQPLVLADDLRR